MAMKLHLSQGTAAQHVGPCTALAWSAGQLLSCGDDGTVWRWNVNSEPLAQVVKVDASIISLHTIPNSRRGKDGNAAGARDVAIAACSDGALRYVSLTNSRVEKTVEAHQGAVTTLAFNPDGSSYVSGGEDGTVKLWSQAGMQRAVVVSTGVPIHGLLWSPEGGDHGSDCILYTNGSEICIRWLIPSAGKKPLSWKAHDGAILKVDWSRTTGHIVTAGEDGKYRIWDPYGRMMFSSVPGDYPVTSVAFSPSGDLLAVGSSNQIRVCDRAGWTHAREQTTTGSLLNLSWSHDGTQVAAAGANGKVAFVHIVHRTAAWKNVTCTMTEANRVSLVDVVTERTETLEHRDKIVRMVVGFGHLVVVTTTQCVVYNLKQWTAPPITIDVKDLVHNVLVCERSFGVVDASGVSLYTYEGRPISTLRVNARLVSISPDTIAVQEAEDLKRINFYDTSSAKLVRDASVIHNMEVVDIALSQFGGMSDRKLVLMDRSRDLHIVSVHQKVNVIKLCTMASSFMWNDQSDILVVISDCKLLTWYCPGTVFIDRDLLPATRVLTSAAGMHDFGRNDHVVDFVGTRYTVRRGSDGAVLTFSVAPYPMLLYESIASNDWESATRLCRMAKDPMLWSVLCAVAVKNSQLLTAEIAYAALEDADKVRHMKHIRDIAVPEAQQAELALFQHRTEEAEKILLLAGLIYRAIRMHIRMYNWERALEIASERRTHVDTVLAFRQRYLESFGKTETHEKFKHYASSGIVIDWETINAKIKEEKEKEKQRGAGKR
eukprot:PhM_4_TR6687/c0_g1_i1/m.56010/K19678/IFT80; intraflagellar transport protein 80